MDVLAFSLLVLCAYWFNFFLTSRGAMIPWVVLYIFFSRSFFRDYRYNYRFVLYENNKKFESNYMFFSMGTFIFDLNGSYCIPKIMTINEIIHCERGNNK